jgi:hypothetical protein
VPPTLETLALDQAEVGQPGGRHVAPSTRADVDAVVAEPEPSVKHAEKDAGETVVPEGQEIGDEATSGALVTTTFLVGCPSGDP